MLQHICICVLSETIYQSTCINTCAIHFSSNWITSNRNQINTVSVPLAIWQIMTQMRTVYAHGFSTALQNAYILPHDFLIAEGWPPMRLTLF